MPRPYTRKGQREIDDLYKILLFCDLDGAGISEKRRDELLEWLWRQMRHEHKKWGSGPHKPTTKFDPPRPRSLQLILRYNQLKRENAHSRGSGENAKKILMEELSQSAVLRIFRRFRLVAESPRRNDETHR